MKPEYFDAVVLVIIDRLNKQGIPCGISNLVDHAQMGNKTIAKAIGRLEANGRLTITKFPQTYKPWEYAVNTPPTEAELALAAIHLGEKLEVVPNGHAA
jgi:hypothetical protein